MVAGHGPGVRQQALRGAPGGSPVRRPGRCRCQERDRIQRAWFSWFGPLGSRQLPAEGPVRLPTRQRLAADKGPGFVATRTLLGQDRERLPQPRCRLTPPHIRKRIRSDCKMRRAESISPNALAVTVVGPLGRNAGFQERLGGVLVRDLRRVRSRRGRLRCGVCQSAELMVVVGILAALLALRVDPRRDHQQVEGPEPGTTEQAGPDHSDRAGSLTRQTTCSGTAARRSSSV